MPMNPAFLLRPEQLDGTAVLRVTLPHCHRVEVEVGLGGAHPVLLLQVGAGVVENRPVTEGERAILNSYKL